MAKLDAAQWGLLGDRLTQLTELRAVFKRSNIVLQVGRAEPYAAVVAASSGLLAAAAGSSPRFAGWNDVSAWQGNATARSVTIAGGWPMMSGGSRVGTAQTVGSSRVTTAQTERTRGPSARRAHRVEKL